VDHLVLGQEDVIIRTEAFFRTAQTILSRRRSSARLPCLCRERATDESGTLSRSGSAAAPEEPGGMRDKLSVVLRVLRRRGRNSDTVTASSGGHR
jgi:hypothetical protein